MNISHDHWLEGAKRDIIHGGIPMPIRRCVVEHFTSGATAQSSIDFWKTPAAKGASAHLVIDRDGTIYQCRPFDLTCGHAGKSRWKDPKTGVLYQGMNSHSIGIEIANAGNDDTALKWARKHHPGFGSVNAVHRNGGKSVEWEKFYDPQLAAVFAVTAALVKRYNLDDITGHDCIAPERKDDPGPAFPMQALREECGFAGLPVVHRI